MKVFESNSNEDSKSQETARATRYLNLQHMTRACFSKGAADFSTPILWGLARNFLSADLYFIDFTMLKGALRGG